MIERVSEGLVAGAIAAVFSGIPSTLHGVFISRKPLEPTLAAGSILLRNEERILPLVAAAAGVHTLLSLAWGVILSFLLPRSPTVKSGLAAGTLITILDLNIAGKRFEKIRKLPFGPQLADHLAYGAVVALVLRELRGR